MNLNMELLKRQDRFWMKKVLNLAARAGRRGEVPVASLVVDSQGELLVATSNRREELHSPIAHCETMALHIAGRKIQNWRLNGCTLYCNLEPCIMCAAALVHARIDRVVFGARDAKFGGLVSLYGLHKDARLNHRFEITEGVYAAESAELLKSFFRARRKSSKDS